MFLREITNDLVLEIDTAKKMIKVYECKWYSAYVFNASLYMDMVLSFRKNFIYENTFL